MRVIPREVAKGNHITWSREIRNLQAKLKINSLQRNFLIGTILGDACIIPNVGGNNYRLQVEQCEKQKEYVWWKYQIFKEWVLGEPKYQDRTCSWRFRTITHPVFKDFRQLFYQNKKKIVPVNIDQVLNNPLSLAVWFMDDGARGPKGLGATFNSQSFSFQENQLLRNCLEKNFGLKTSLHKDKKSWRIYVLPQSSRLLVNLIADVVLPNFYYKLPFVDPVET